MPAPTNTSAATATDLGTLPQTIVQDVHDSGTTYTVWYKYTAVAGEVCIGLWGFGGTAGSGYRPTITSWIGPAGAPVAYPSSAQVSGQNVPVQVPVTAGTTYYFRFATNSSTVSPAVLTLAVETAPNQDTPSGTIFIPDDTPEFRGAFLTGSSGDVRRFEVFPAGESAFYQRTSGYLLAEDTSTGFCKLYDPARTTVVNVSFTVEGISAGPGGYITGNQSDQFYVAEALGTGAGASSTIRACDLSGSSVGSWTIAPPGSVSGGLGAIAVDPDDTLLYFHHFNVSSGVYKWDLVGNAFAGTLVAARGSSYVPTRQLLYLGDDTILVLFTRASPSFNVLVDRYRASDGTLLNTYDFSADVVSGSALRFDNQIAHAVDDPFSFWVWLKIGNGLSRFSNVRVSDGTVLTTFDKVQYERGVYQAAETASPLARFGHSESCPFVVLGDTTSGSSTSNAIDCPHGSFTPNILQKSGSYLRTMNRLQGTYETGFTGTGSDTRTFRPKQGTYEPTHPTLSGSY